MTKTSISLFFAAGLTVAFAAEPQAEPLTAYLAARGEAGLVELLPALSRDRGTLKGARGCTNGTEECDDSGRFQAARAYTLTGESLTLFLAGTQPVDVVRVVRDGVTVLEQKNVNVPAEFSLGTAMEGETITATVQRGADSVELSVQAGLASKTTAKSAAIWGYIYTWVYITDGTCPRGWYEIIEGSGTGGRCRSYYTDRAQRGELVDAYYDGAGTAKVGWRYYGSGRSNIIGPVALPYVRQFRVSTDPADDNLWALIGGLGERRIPIGRR